MIFVTVEYSGPFGKAFCDCYLLQCCGVDIFRLRPQRRVDTADPRKPPSAAEPDLETSIGEATHQSFYGSDRGAICQHSRNPAAHGEIFLSIEQRICELADRCRDSHTKSFHRVLTDIVTRKQPYHGCDQYRIKRFLSCKCGTNDVGILGLEINESLHRQIGLTSAGSRFERGFHCNSIKATDRS